MVDPFMPLIPGVLPFGTWVNALPQSLFVFWLWFLGSNERVVCVTSVGLLSITQQLPQIRVCSRPGPSQGLGPFTCHPKPYSHTGRPGCPMRVLKRWVSAPDMVSLIAIGLKTGLWVDECRWLWSKQPWRVCSGLIGSGLGSWLGLYHLFSQSRMTSCLQCWHLSRPQREGPWTKMNSICFFTQWRDYCVCSILYITNKPYNAAQDCFFSSGSSMKHENSLVCFL